MIVCLRSWFSRLLLLHLSFSLIALAPGQTLNSFESDSDVLKPQLEVNLCSATRSNKGVTKGSSAIYAAFAAAPTGYPGFNSIYNSLDLSGAGIIAIDATNFGPITQSFTFVVTDASGMKLERAFDVDPGETRPCGLDLTMEDAASYGLKSLPVYFMGINLARSVAQPGFQLSRIKKIGVYVRRPTAATYFAFDAVRTISIFTWKDVLTNTVDRFGQRTWGNVPGQISSIADLTSRRLAEQASLNSAPSFSDRTAIGGWKSGPQYANSTGYFGLKKYNGKWYLHAPDGSLFFSAGLDGLTPTEAPTSITDRDYMFTWLPAASAPEAQFLSSPVWNGKTLACYDYTGANNFKKYGDVSANWLTMAVKRQEKWGFNTTGCYVNYMMWSVPNRPFTVELVTESTAKRFSVMNTTKTMIDVFDPNFAAQTETSMKKFVTQYKVNTNANLIGYTTDNELAFRSQSDELDMAESVLGYTSDSLATKAVLVGKLKTKYGSVDALNAAWGTQFVSWTALDGKVTVNTATDAFVADMHAFVTVVAKKFYSTWLTTIRKYDTNHLYLGSKCDYLSADIIEGMQGSVDVISLNRYATSLDADLALLDQYTIPFYLSEFSASTARGNNFAVGVSSAMADTQAERATICEHVFRQALANKNCVGVHFFRLYDDPVTGAYKDGANGNFGLCDITDTPYSEMVQMFQRVNRDIYKR